MNILEGSHYCDFDKNGEHRNADCAGEDLCVCTMCGTFWHWNIWNWEAAMKERREHKPV